MAKKPIEFGEKEIEQVRTLAPYLTKEDIAAHMNMSLSAYYNVERRQPEVALAFKQGKAKGTRAAAGVVMREIKKGSLSASRYYLDRRSGWGNNADKSSRDEPEEAEPESGKKRVDIMDFTPETRKQIMRERQRIGNGESEG